MVRKKINHRFIKEMDMKILITFLIATSLSTTASLAQSQTQQQIPFSQSPTADQQSQTPMPSQQESAPSASDSSSGQDNSSQSQSSGSNMSSDGQSQQSNPSQAQSSDQSSQSDRPQTDIAAVKLQPKTENGVTYLCGGIGIEEASYMKQAAGDYDLMLTFASRKGEYLADVEVDIKDAKGNPILSANCDAPIMLVDVPKSGTYRVQAKAENYTSNRTVKVQETGRAKSVVMTWPRESAATEGVAQIRRSQETESTGSSDSSSSGNSAGESSNQTEKSDDETSQPRR
jgi:hypothetical protein